MHYKKTTKHNTNYYRRNKEERFNVKCCPHCNYETTGPKSALIAHIHSKHTPENERPFQCPCIDCDRGYAARANLQKHICKHHNTNMKVFNKNSFLILFPEMSKEWHPTKNGELTPDMVSYGSGKNIWWLCSNGHSYESTINHRTRKSGKKCPYCAGQKSLNSDLLSNVSPNGV